MLFTHVKLFKHFHISLHALSLPSLCLPLSFKLYQLWRYIPLHPLAFTYAFLSLPPPRPPSALQELLSLSSPRPTWPYLHLRPVTPSVVLGSDVLLVAHEPDSPWCQPRAPPTTHAVSRANANADGASPKTSIARPSQLRASPHAWCQNHANWSGKVSKRMKLHLALFL